MSRPAAIAVSQQARDNPPMTASRRCSRGDSSRCPRACQASDRRITSTLINASRIAGNLIARKGLPTYSVALVTSRPTPVVAAIRNPVAATGTVASASAASGIRRPRPTSRRSSTRTEPKSDATPRMCARLTIAYVQAPDSRMKWPRAEPCSHFAASSTSGSIGIDVKDLVAPRQPLGLDLVPIVVAVAMAVRRDLGADRDHAVLEACLLAARRRREDEVPYVAVRAFDGHGRVRAGQAHRRLDRAG